MSWGWLRGTLRKLQPAERSEVGLDATAQPLLGCCRRLAGFDGLVEDRAGFILHRSAVSGGLDAQLGLSLC